MSKKYHIVIAQYIRTHPDKTWQEVAAFFGISMTTTSRIARGSGLGRSVTLDDDAIASLAQSAVQEKKSSE